MSYPATLLCDFYKVSHIDQYPEGTEFIYSTWTPRKSRIPGVDKAVAFAFQYFAKEYLVNYFNEMFFRRSEEEVVAEYVRVIKFTLGVENPRADHIRKLHQLGYLPLRVRAVKEGTLVPMRVPMLTVENTHPEFFWLTNYFESLMSAEFWQPSTAATIAKEYRRILDGYAIETTGSTAGVEFQAHDFSFRGMEGLVGATNSAAGHLLSFVGTDSIPGILFHERYYGANIEKELVGTSIPATEHSVMCANADENQDEMESFRRLVTKVYPNGFISIVSDSYDFWGVVENILPALKDEILARDGKVVIRPDSGDPVKIICGDPDSDNELVRKGLIHCLWDIFGGTVNEQGYKVLDPHIGAIYGDSITLERCEQICSRLKNHGFASTNVVFGVGSYTYQYNTRDTFGYAMKATWAQVNGEEKLIFKDPKTDDGTKRSQRGRVAVINVGGEIVFQDGLDKKTYEANFANIDLMEDIFVDGEITRTETLAEIRERLAAQ
jgi:nicotinamide phosphoribosyltransferase